MWILRACSGGLISGLAGGTKINLFTEIEDVDGIDFAVVVYRYKHNADTEHYLRKSPQNELLLIPTRERAIVEYIQGERYQDEGLLIEAIKTYLEESKDLELLYEVADFFSLDRKTLDYWLKEAKEDIEY